MINPTPRFLHSIEKDGQTAETRTLIILHELGGIANRISKAKRLGHESLFMADIKIDIGQALLQLEMLALDLGLQPEECHRIGLETTWQHFKEWGWGNENHA